MEVSYKKDGNQNFMIIKDRKINQNDYKLQMVANNQIEGLLPINILTVNNKKEIHYCITSKTSMENLYARKKMSGLEIYNLIRDIQNLADKLKEYLLDINNIIFSLDHIYVKNKINKYEFSYLPDNENRFEDSLRELFEYILENINHNDKKAVLIAYGIQQITISSDFTINDLMICAKENLKEPRIETGKNSIEDYKLELSKCHKINEESEDENIDEQIDIMYKEQQKDKKGTFFQKVLKFIKKRDKYKDEEQLEQMENAKFSYNMEETMSDSTGMLQEEMTTLLTSSGKFQTITLRGTDLENPIEITPSSFPCILGKSKKSSHYAIDNSVVSRVHVRILEDREGYMIEDLNSTNGTFINGERLNPHEPININVGDSLMLANVDFIVE